jgi:hypothetical protein
VAALPVAAPCGAAVGAVECLARRRRLDSGLGRRLAGVHLRYRHDYERLSFLRQSSEYCIRIRKSLEYESGTCGQKEFRKMLRILVLRAKWLSEAVPGSTGSDTLDLELRILQLRCKFWCKGSSCQMIWINSLEIGCSCNIRGTLINAA